MLVKINVVSDSFKDRFFPEVRVDDDLTVLDLKNKLHFKTGVNVSSMNLFAFHPSNPENKTFLDDDSKTLNHYSVGTGFTVEIKETKHTSPLDPESLSSHGQKNDLLMDYSSMAKSNPKLFEHYVKQLEKSDKDLDETSFEKYEISEEDYHKRNTGVREFINRMRAKNESKTRLSEPESDHSSKDSHLNDLKTSFPLESRCCVFPGELRGLVKYVGFVDKSTVKIGVCLDEPLGDSDGKYNNKRFFDSSPNYAAFFDPVNVKVGDYPPEDPFDMVD